MNARNTAPVLPTARVAEAEQGWTSPLAKDGGYFAMSFGPSTGVVRLIRRFAEEFFTEVLGHSEGASRVALATHELLENAVSYCSQPDISIRGSLTPAAHGFYVTIRTRNPASFERCTEARRRVDELTKLQDPAAHYQQILLAPPLRGRPTSLGLARVRAEAQMLLSCEATDGELTVVASANISAVAPADALQPRALLDSSTR